MTAVQAIAVVIIRFWALGATITLSFSLSLTIGAFMSGQEAYGYLQLASSLAALAFWALILVFSKTVASWGLPPVKAYDHKFDIEPADIIRMGTFLIGVFYLIDYGVQFLRALPGNIVRDIGAGQTVKLAVNWNEALRYAPYLIGIVIALLLIFRLRHFARAFFWLRYARPSVAAADGKRKTE